MVLRVIRGWGPSCVHLKKKPPFYKDLCWTIGDDSYGFIFHDPSKFYFLATKG